MHVEYEFNLDEMQDDLSYGDLVPQAQIIWQAIISSCRHAGINQVTEDQMGEMMQYLVNEGILQTSQRPLRVFKYYRCMYGRYSMDRYTAKDVVHLSIWSRIKLAFKMGRPWSKAKYYK